MAFIVYMYIYISMYVIILVHYTWGLIKPEFSVLLKTFYARDMMQKNKKERSKLKKELFHSYYIVSICEREYKCNWTLAIALHAFNQECKVKHNNSGKDKHI